MKRRAENSITASGKRAALMHIATLSAAFITLFLLLPSRAVYASASKATELERMQGFSDYLIEEGLTDSVVGYGDFDENVSDESLFYDWGMADQRLRGMAAEQKAMEKEYGPYVPDVVTVISSPDKQSASEAQRLESLSLLAQETEEVFPGTVSADAAGQSEGTQYGSAQYDRPQTPEAILAAAENRVLNNSQSLFDRESLLNLRLEVDGALSGSTFPTTNWRRFGTELESLGTFTLTAYDPCLICCGKTDGITATGTHGKTGRTIAVDPRVIPYGSRVVIGGYVYIAEDTGSAIKGRHIDMFMDTHEIAMQFGKREGEVFLIR